MSYPQPTGPYKTGKVAYDWADQGRPEIATGNATSRELMVYVWYPADVSANMAEAPVMDARIAGAVRPGDAFSLGFLKDFSDHTYKDLPLSANRSQYPVLIMSHSDTSSPLLMAVTAADMASHGYIVVGISHTYNARGTVFPDGRVSPATITIRLSATIISTSACPIMRTRNNGPATTPKSREGKLTTCPSSWTGWSN